MTDRRRVLAAAAMFAAAALLAGCDSGPKLYKVTGTVTWKGVPIADGRINFIADDGKTTPAAANIVDGKYEVMTTAGLKKVEVFNQRDKGYDPVMKQHTRTNDIPDEYGAFTKLRYEVRPADDNVYDLDLPQK